MISKNWRLWYAGQRCIGLRRRVQTNVATSSATGSGMTNNKALVLQFILYLVTFFDIWASKLSHVGRQACFPAGVGLFFLCHRIQTSSVANPATCKICTESTSPGITWPKHDGDPSLSGTAKVSHVCRLTLPYPHIPYLVHLLQGFWHFRFCPNYSSLLHIISCM